MPNVPVRSMALLAASVLLGSCAAPFHGSGYGDSVNATCRTNPAACAAMAGKESVELAIKAGTLHAALRAMDGAMQKRIEEALEECADQARTTVLERRTGGKSPSREECNERVGQDSQGNPVTKAMRMGEEMHREALRCTEEKLSKLRPKGFSVEPRYRYDPRTGRTTRVSPEEAEALLRQGRGSELRGTLVPDVTLHPGDPLNVEAIYDFKFPCVNTDEVPGWRDYPRGHPFEGFSQGEMYERALGKTPARIVPRLGVIR